VSIFTSVDSTYTVVLSYVEEAAEADFAGGVTMTRFRRGRLILCALVATVLTASCSSNSSDGSTVAGALQGRMLIIGGPVGPITPNASPPPTAHPDVNTSVKVSQRGKTIGSTRADADGAFAFTLRPGTYSVQGADGCTGSVSVVIKSSTTTNVTLSCQAP